MLEFFKNLEPLEPVPTTEAFVCRLSAEKISKIKAVVFDVYGTMLVSGSGDIGGFRGGKQNVLQALISAGVCLNGKSSDVEFGKHVIQTYISVIKKYHCTQKEKGIAFPEVVIEKIWEQVLAELVEEGAVNGDCKVNWEQLAIHFEFMCNPTYPMPGLRKTLQMLIEHHFDLGIVSNAQFFTPLLMQYFLTNKIGTHTSPISFFKKDYTIYSYQLGVAKPDVELFSKLDKALQSDGLSSEQVLFVGNDMLNDIYPAAQLGFKTALFAGDKRSLRLRNEWQEVKNVTPDMVITQLPQIVDTLIPKHT